MTRVNFCIIFTFLIRILDFEESDQFFPEYILFMNSTRKPHKIDDNFAILEISQQTKRVRIGVGNEKTQKLSNTIKFSISQGQKVLAVRASPEQIWIQDRVHGVYYRGLHIDARHICIHFFLIEFWQIF